ncbi:MAG: methyl-accepting chemotaxis protein [Candidatus Thiodiazotropha sp.]|nr:methyl-accepting chemotaxis protein [Candidatus Thiodiazotropha sp.]MCM8883242.1 methyl-accepting chemotaxis protein [Candidatus Thiodiazotropha sp.]MCM8920957.1 methyl-accepting chemotaxis protein [Candidatus Thiodiazotropha sp.]
MKNLISNLSVKAKIVGNTLILMALMIIGSTYALNSMNQIGTELDAIALQDIPMTENLTKLTEHYLEQANHFERAMRYGMLLQQEANASEHFKQNIAVFEQFSKEIDENIHTGERMVEEAITQVYSEEDAKEFERVDQALKKIGKEHDDFEQHANQVFVLLSQGNIHEAEVFAEKIEHEEKQLATELQDLLSEIEKFTENAVKRAEQHEHAAFKMMIVLTMLALLIGGIVSWSVSRNIVKRLSEASRELEVIASGDLTQCVSVEGQDEISNLQKSMQTMHKHLQTMISQIHATTVQLATAAEEVSVVTTQTSTNIQQQQSETDQIATAMNEMASTVQEVATSVSNTSNAAKEANVETEKSREIVDETVQGIQQLADQIEGGAKVISQVEKDSENINTVLDVIKGIAEQTNLLALNAAIEAARAGEQGRGFAVVADEVRTLAGRTQESTTEINQIIEKLQTGSKNAVQTMNQSREQARSVVEQATLAGTSLSTIAQSASEIDQMSSQIATAAEEQSAVADEMSRSIVRINDMTSQNASGANQTEQAGQELAQMASQLQEVVSQFQVK